MTVAEVLQNLRPLDPAPTIAELGGERLILDELSELDAQLVPRLVEAVSEHWDEVGDAAVIGDALVGRLPDIEGALSFANSADALLAVTVVSSDAALTRTLMTRLLEIIDDGHVGGERALRAGYAGARGD